MKMPICLLLLLLGGFMYGQTDTLTLQHMPFDSLLEKGKQQLREAATDPAYPEVLQIARYALSLAGEADNPIQMGDAYTLLANWHYFSITSNNPDSVYQYSLKALEQYRQTDSLSLIARGSKRVGSDLAGMGRFREAESYLFDAARIYESLDDQKALASTYASLNYLYRESRNWSEAVRYGERSLAIIEAIHQDERELIQPLLGLIFTYPEVGKAEMGLEKAEQVVQIVGSEYDWADNVHMANVRSWRGEAHVTVGNYEKALADFIYSWEVIQTMVPEPSDADGWRGNIGNVLRLQGKYAEAIPHIKANLRHHLEKNIDDWKLIEDNQFWLAECYRETGPADSAYYYLAQAQQSQEKRLTEELAAVQNELRIKYDSDQKEATISSQQATILQQRRSQLLVLGIVALLVALLAVILYNARRNRQKNRRLEVLNKELTHTNHQLDQRNAQNEVLVKEIHHRVKNNLEIISSLLELQSRQTQDETAQLAMLESQARVKSMGLLHQKLFQNQEQVSIEMRDYFQKLSNNLLQTFNVREQVDVQIDMDPIELDMDTAIPIGLMVNELITNSLKYAFPDRRNGRIELRLQPEDSEYLELTVADNGVGKEPVTAPKGTGFGSQLIQLLTQQLQGVMQESHGVGTSVTFRLKRVLHPA
jgi:two-component sensor histidine kinase